MSQPYLKQGTFTGTSAATLDISPQYRESQITITGPTSGLMTIRAKAQDSNVFEEVIGGDIRLDFQKTIKITGYQLQSLEFTIQPQAAFSVYVRQYAKYE